VFGGCYFRKLLGQKHNFVSEAEFSEIANNCRFNYCRLMVLMG
jgi:hypothetical protein